MKGHNFMKKKLTAFLMAAVMFAALMGCAQTGASSEPGKAEEAVQEEAAPEEEQVTSDQADSAETAEESVFPVTITHALGETVIESAPERVVTIGWGNLDIPLALGTAPVGVSKATYGATDENGLFYWTNEAFAALGVESPNVFDDTDGLDFEAIYNAEPDLILAVYSGISEEEYAQLSEIAPTVAYTKEAWATTWQDLTIDNGRALGKEDEAKALVDEITSLIAEKTADHPEIQGLTAAYCYFDTSNLGSFYVYMPKDPRASNLDDGSFFFMTVSSENIDVLNDLDLIVTWGEADTLDALQADPLISQVPAVARGSVVFLSNDTSLIAASCTPTPLAIKATIDEYPDISEAAKKLN